MQQKNNYFIILFVLITCNIFYQLKAFDQFLSSSYVFYPFLPDSHNDSLIDCDQLSCSKINKIGSFADFLPPPPWPPFKSSWLENISFATENEEGCNFCHIYNQHSDEDSELNLTQPKFKSNSSWSPAWFFLVLATLFFLSCSIVVWVRHKNWKRFHFSVGCLNFGPIFRESFIGRHKPAPPTCTSTNSCTSPVVNEKSPQSIITNCSNKITSMQKDYWRHANNLAARNAKNMMNSCGPDLDDYTPCTEGGSCTSSPVYAELDSEGINHNPLSSSLLITGPSQSISPYTVHTYTEVADAMRMAALGSSTALLPDASYDNAAYLPTINNDPYHNRQIRNNRALASVQLGSAAPLLAASHHISNLPSPAITNYLSGNRFYKKPKPIYTRHVQRSNTNKNNQTFDNFCNRYTFGRKHESIYADFPLHSPQLSTFRVPYSINLREASKRPLPPVPGVRL